MTLWGERYLFDLVAAFLEEANHAVRPHHVGCAHHDECRFLPLEELFRRWLEAQEPD